MALDLSYIIPIFLLVNISPPYCNLLLTVIEPNPEYLRRRYYRNHPEVLFKPGPFYMGDGWLGWSANIICILWTLFVCVLFSLPTIRPVTPDNMNYAAVITCGVVILSGYVHLCFVFVYERGLIICLFPRAWYFLGYVSYHSFHMHNSDFFLTAVGCITKVLARTFLTTKIRPHSATLRTARSRWVRSLPRRPPCISRITTYLLG